MAARASAAPVPPRRAVIVNLLDDDDALAAAFADADAARAELVGAVGAPPLPAAVSVRTHWMRARREFARSLERQLVAAWRVWFVSRPRPVRASHPSGRCALHTCAAERVRVRLFATDARYAPDEAEPLLVRDVETPDGRSLHACTAFCLRVRERALHYRDVTDTAVAAGLGVLADAGAVYWCAYHAKAHVCDETCAEGDGATSGVERCVLSRRELGATLRAAFGDGSRDAPATAEHEAAAASASASASATTHVRAHAERSVPTLSTMARSSVRRRSAAANAFHDHLDADDEIELIALAPARKRARHVNGTTVVKREPDVKREPEVKREVAAVLPSTHPATTTSTTTTMPTTTTPAPSSRPVAAVGVHVHVDDPRVRRFASVARLNTFADDVGQAMRVVYGQCYAAVELVLFSDERAGLEERRAALVDAEVEYVLRAYLTEAERTGGWVTHDEARRRADEARGTRRRYPFLVLPPGGVARACAYYAMLVLEFFWSVRPLARVVVRAVDALLAAPALAPKRTRRNAKLAARAAELASYRERAARLQTYTAADATPIVLELARRGFRELLLVFFERDALLGVLACESAVLQQLYVAERTCTQIMRDIKQTVAAARDLGLALHSLVASQMPLADVLDTHGSVVDAFLERRRARLHLT